VALWLPEAYGPVDFDSARQLALLNLLGVRSQREVSHARYRVIGAMRAGLNCRVGIWPAP
jgi:site-specific DNA recombinase